ncbi:MAG TPA: hypothetical protein VIL84_09080 [Devosiaceae bacterium]
MVDQSTSDARAWLKTHYETCHPADTLEALETRAGFSKEDRGLLADWLATARVATSAARV